MRRSGMPGAAQGVAGVRGRRSGAEHLTELRGELVGLAGLAVLAAEEPAVTAREDDGLGPEPPGDRLAAAMGELAIRLLADGDHDPRRRGAERVDVRLVVGARDDVLGEEGVRP